MAVPPSAPHLGLGGARAPRAPMDGPRLLPDDVPLIHFIFDESSDRFDLNRSEVERL